MPCGGIYPLTSHWAAHMLDTRDPSHACFYCGNVSPRVTHFCEEWDCYLHDYCIDPFLTTREGRIVLQHGHEVIRR